MEDFHKDEIYFRAKKRIKELKGFYGHLTAYIIINLFLLILYHVNDIRNGQLTFEWWRFSTLFFWGLGLGVHALSVFGKHYLLNGKWEERKLKQFMEEEEKRFSKFK